MTAAPELDSAGDPDGVPRLVDLLLEEQSQLTAVERFATRHEEGPSGVGSYHELLPASPPGPGQQYAFRVDLDACTGCKACVTACHNLNGLGEDETWRAVGTLVAQVDTGPAVQTVTTACHHCEDPGCLSGCPVQAYDKDPFTGIVRHLDDQCIGCQYCLLKCPYDVPQYRPELGIVRKCDMCAGRLAEGEAPACVQGCPNDAISISVVDRDLPRPDRLLAVGPGAMPASSVTRPTTRYVSRRPRREYAPANLYAAEPRPAHDPLAIMLVLVQLAVGIFAVDAGIGWIMGWDADAETGTLHAALATAGLAAAGLGMGASTAHLGRPRYAFRAFLGLRTSWMSREIVVLGPFLGLAAALAGALTLPAIQERLPDANTALAGVLASTISWTTPAVPWLSGAVVGIGALGIFCSAMIYADTGRPLWGMPRTAALFFGTALTLGTLAGLAAVLVCVPEPPTTLSFGLAVAAAAGLIGKGVVESAILGERRNPTALGGTARLLLGPLRVRFGLRLGAAGLALTATGLAPLLGGPGPGAALAILALAAATAGELLERHLFFTSEASRAMPGL